MKRFFGNPAVLVFLILYVVSFSVLARNKEFQPGESLLVLVLFGIVLPLVAWFATRGAKPLNLASAQSGWEVLLVLGLLIALAIYLIHGPQAIDALLPRAWTGSPQIHFFVTMTKKLLIFVLLPLAAFRIDRQMATPQFSQPSDLQAEVAPFVTNKNLFPNGSEFIATWRI